MLENLQVIATKTILKHLGILSPSEQMPLKRDLALKTQRPQISDRNGTTLGDGPSGSSAAPRDLS